MRGLRILRVIGPRRTKGGDFVAAIELSDGEIGGLILPDEQLDQMAQLLKEEQARSPRQKREIPRLQWSVGLDDDVPETVSVARIEVREPVNPETPRVPGIHEIRFENDDGQGATLRLSHNELKAWRDPLNEQIANPYRNSECNAQHCVFSDRRGRWQVRL